MTTAKDIMHTGATWIPAHETLDRAAQLMRDHKVGALPISANGEQDRMIGILTDRDIVVGCVAMGHDPSKMTAGDLAHGTPRWIDAEAQVEAVLEEMQTHRIHAASGGREQDADRHDQRGRSGSAPQRRADHAAGRRRSTRTADPTAVRPRGHGPSPRPGPLCPRGAGPSRGPGAGAVRTRSRDARRLGARVIPGGGSVIVMTLSGRMTYGRSPLPASLI